MAFGMELIELPFRALRNAGKIAKGGWQLTGDTKSRKKLWDSTRKSLAGTVESFKPEESLGKSAGKFLDDNFTRYIRRQKSIPGKIVGGLMGGLNLGVGAVVGLPMKVASRTVSTAMGAVLGLPVAAALGTGRLLHRAAKAKGVYTGLGKVALGGAVVTGKIGWEVGKRAAHVAAWEGTKAAVVAGKSAKFIWNMRDNSGFQTLAFLGIMGGAVAYGANQGANDAFNGQVDFDPYASTFTNPTPDRGPARKPKAIDHFGASGDLVFALNNLRGGGMM